MGDTKIEQTYSSAITFNKLLEDFPEIETGTKFLKLGQVPVHLNNEIFYESRIFAVDSVFYDVFTIPLIHGNPKTVLNQPNNIPTSTPASRRDPSIRRPPLRRPRRGAGPGCAGPTA